MPKCIVCGKDITSFKRGGITNFCSTECKSSDYYKKNKELLNKKSREYHNKHKEEINKKNREYYADHIEEEREKGRIHFLEYYAKNKERILRQHKEWRKRNYEKSLVINRKAMFKYVDNNRDVYNDMMRESTFTLKNKEAILKIIGSKCRECGKDVEEIHHTSYNLPNHSNKELKEYCKYLIPLCRDCHKKLHRENSNKVYKYQEVIKL